MKKITGIILCIIIITVNISGCSPQEPIIHNLAVEISQDHFSHLIISPEEFTGTGEDYSLEALRDHRLSTGMTSNIVTLEYIYSGYEGDDEAEKIKNYIIHAHENKGTEYVLLVGNETYIPVKYYVIGDTLKKSIASDNYYSMLYEDEQFDVYIGRALVDDKRTLSNFVYKTITYETSPINASFHTKGISWTSNEDGLGVFPGWRTPVTGSGFNSDRNEFTLETLNNVGRINIDRAFRSRNLGFMIAGAHGYYDRIWHFDNFYVRDLKNENNHFFLTSIACYPGKFGRDGFAQNLTTISKGGAFAAVLNYEIGYAESVHFISAMLDAYFREGEHRLGEIVKNAKVRFSRQLYNERNHITLYSQNLFGDPATVLRTKFADSKDLHISFDGESLKDQSKNHEEITISENALFTEGVFGEGLKLSGDSYARVSHSDWAPMGNQLEISAGVWINPSVSGKEMTIFSKGESKQTFRLDLTGEGTLKLEIAGSNFAGDPLIRESEGTISPGKWNHIAFSYEHVARRLTFYINGKEDSVHFTDRIYFYLSEEDFFIGKNPENNTGYFNGKIDDIRIYGRRLFDSDIEDMMNNNLVTKENADLRNRFTIIAGINPGRINEETDIVFKGDEDEAFRLYITEDRKIAFDINRGSPDFYSGKKTFVSSSGIRNNKKTRIAVVYDGEYLGIYIDGKADSYYEMPGIILGKNEKPITENKDIIEYLDFYTRPVTEKPKY